MYVTVGAAFATGAFALLASELCCAAHNVAAAITVARTIVIFNGVTPTSQRCESNVTGATRKAALRRKYKLVFLRGLRGEHACLDSLATSHRPLTRFPLIQKRQHVFRPQRSRLFELAALLAI